jgi:hypothetical protein
MGTSPFFCDGEGEDDGYGRVDGKCGWGPNGYGEDGRDYFDKPAAVEVELTSGKTVIIHGRYTGYGEVETETGHTFYHPQFEEFWGCWLDGTYNNHGEKGPFIAKKIYCEECLYGRDPTPISEYDFSDMVKVVDYLKKEEDAAAAAVAAAAAPVVAASPAPAGAGAPKKKIAKPKPLTKEQLVTKVAQLEAEVTRLKPYEERATRLGTMYAEMQTKYTKIRAFYDKIETAMNEYRWH